MKQPSISDLKNPIHCLSLGFGSGLINPAPGTWGTVASLIPWLLIANISPIPYVVVLVVGLLIGIYLCDQTSKHLGVHDHSGIVWDEFIGMWIALFLVPQTILGIPYLGVLIAFLFFRLFDITKPWPIKVIDTQVHSGLGIMMDDVIAGIFACLCTHGLIWGLLQLSL